MSKTAVHRSTRPLKINLGQLIAASTNSPKRRPLPKLPPAITTAAAIARDALTNLSSDESIELEAIPPSDPDDGTMLVLRSGSRTRLVLIVPTEVIRSKRLRGEGRLRDHDAEQTYERLRLHGSSEVHEDLRDV